MYCGKCGQNFTSEEDVFCAWCGTSRVATGMPVDKSAMTKKRFLVGSIIAGVALVIVLIVTLIFFFTPSNGERQLTVSELLELGEQLLLDGDYEQALIQFLQAIEVEPMNPRGYTGAAEAYIGLGRVEEAVDILRKGLVELPDNQEILDMFMETGSELGSATMPQLVPETESAPEIEPELEIFTESEIDLEPPLPTPPPVEYITIHGVQYSTSLTELFLMSASLTDSDIEPLQHMENLMFLSLGDNNISDITPLAGLTNLTAVDLFDTGISDITPLAGLTNLTALVLDINHISDISPLAGLTNLTWLTLSGNNISDLSPLSGLTNLQVLTLDNNSISDITPLAGLTNLYALGLNDNSITDITPLSSLSPDVAELHLLNNPIADWSPVSHIAIVEGRQ